MGKMFNNFRISQKLPFMLAALAALAAVITGGTVYFKSAAFTHKQVTQNLTALSAEKAGKAKEFFNQSENQLSELAASPQILAAYYQLGPNAEAILQKAYIDDNRFPNGEKDKMISAGTGTNYDAIHAAIHPWMRSILRTNDFYDIFLFDPQGRDVYTVFKERDFATQLANGRWKDSSLGNLVRKVIKNGANSPAILEDFAPYSPSNNVPAGFVAMPIKGSDGSLKGVIAVQLSINKLDAAMGTSPINGKTGENALIGVDGLMRNNTPLSKEPTILQRKIDNEFVKKAFDGKTLSAQYKNAYGKTAYAAFTPLEVMGSKYVVVSDITASEVNAPLNALALQVAFVSLFIALIASLIGIFFSRSVTKPIVAITECMGDLAKGNTAITIPNRDNGDEIGTMAKAVEIFRLNAIECKKLEDKIKADEEISKAQRKQMLIEITEDYERAAGDLLRTVAAAAAELSATAQSMTDAAGRTNQMAASVASAAEQSTSNAQIASNSASSLTGAISHIDNASGESANVATEAVAISNDAQNAVSELVHAANNISEVIDMIHGIAEQTNLLALNATIEAARAGSAGAGFAIVAQEVKNLANQTSDATNDISRQITSIQAVVSSASASMEKIAGVISRISALSGDIGNSVAAQAQVTDEIARSISEVAAASKSVAGDIIKVTGTAAETGVAASQVLSASQELSVQATKLEHQTNEFLARVRAA